MQKALEQTTTTAMTNLCDMCVVEMKKLAPFANPAQYPNGYPGVPGTLSRSIKRDGTGFDCEIISDAGYGLLRNEHNNLNPQTKHYIERSTSNVLNGKSSQWWRADESLRL